MAEVRADLVEVVGEAVEVAAEIGDVRHHLVRMLLDLHAAQPERDHLQVRRERRRRNREDAPVVRVREQRSGLAAGELVVHPFDGDVHEGEVVGALVGPDVLRRDRVDVLLDVAAELPLCELPLVVRLGVDEPDVVVEWELRVDRDRPVGPHDRVDALAAESKVYCIS